MRCWLQQSLCFRQRMKETHQVRFREKLSLTLQLASLANGRLQQLIAARNLSNQKIAKVGQQIAAEVSQIVTAHHYVVHDRERFGRLVMGNAIHHSDQSVCAGDAEGHLDVFLLDFSPGETDYLIE